MDGPRSFYARERAARLVLELAIFWRPGRVQRRVEHRLELRPRLVLPPFILEQLAEEEVRRRARRVVRERLAEMRFGLLPVAAEQAGHLEVPAPERPVGRPVEERAIEPQHRLELLLDRLAVLQPLA